ncbi:MAG: hypothetical protein M3R36_17330 [Bacteroidota bacterium]|nr:hypothetical protein [Bacteroidota bacterium]
MKCNFAAGAIQGRSKEFVTVDFTKISSKEAGEKIKNIFSHYGKTN